jgi:hypothetical protein
MHKDDSKIRKFYKKVPVAFSSKLLLDFRT